MAPFGEKRKWTRIERRIKIDAILVDPEKREGLFKLDAVWTKDVGGNGLGLVTRAHCMVGSTVDLHFQLPGTQKPIEAKGRIVWSKLEENSNDQYRIGVAFAEIKESDRQAIMRYVESEAQKQSKSRTS